MAEEHGLCDILVAKRISEEKIREILMDAFGLNGDGIMVVPYERLQDPLGTDPSNVTCLCTTHEARGDISMMLSVSGCPESDDIAKKKLIYSFLKFGVSAYFDKDNFNEFYHIDESNKLVIAVETNGAGSVDDIARFAFKSPYDGSLGVEIEEVQWDRAAWCSSFPLGLD